MNHKIIETLEFEQIKGRVAQHLVSAAGKRELAALMPATDYQTVDTWLTETTDGADILRLEGGLPLPKLADIKPQMKRLKIGANLNGTELAQVTKVLQASLSVQNFFEQMREKKIKLRVLDQLVDRLVTIPSITQRLIRSVDPDGRLNGEASTKLHGIRQLIVKTEGEIHQQMEHYTRGKGAKYLSEPVVTIRNDRYVVPALARYRNKLGGVVHDQSASGQTLYIEAAGVV